ncbi:MAG: hypothetical protein NC082_09555 [Clostridiales bacterium]|nr:hypothetical protein [Clostridiales bacterium]
MKIVNQILLFLAMALPITSVAVIEDYRRDFLTPTDENRAIMIWQWMDGLVTKEAITKDLEAFKAAGLSGVQNFQIGGDGQIRVGNAGCAIGSEQWKEMMKWAMTECRRLGLTFGTHNCPGWSSSAYGNVEPEYAMQKLVYTDTVISIDDLKHLDNIHLPRPLVAPEYDYYDDIAVLAFPNDSIVAKSDILNFSKYLKSDRLSGIECSALSGDGDIVIMRIGHTTNGKTNAAQAPLSGQGLECDKMRRDAVKHFWDGYPAMLLEIAGEMAGTVFNRIEIDSYEAGGQNWSVVIPDEFMKRKEYDIIPYLPFMVGRILVDDRESCDIFMKDLVDVATSLVAENYYGYMNELASMTPGMQLLIEPYGTGRQRPFQLLDMNKILAACPGAIIATEFWVKPETWGWKDMGKHEKVIRQRGINTLYAEGFTCWPLHAWKDCPESLKPICDRAFCTGVNRMMLHAAAVNPWINYEPGMSFGIWGTQFVPTQTWWKAGGAKALFDYMARCQSLLQRGYPAQQQAIFTPDLKSYHRIDGENDIIFLCNPTDSSVCSNIDLGKLAFDRYVEIWDPYSLLMAPEEERKFDLTIEPYGSRFIVISPSLFSMRDDDHKPENKLVSHDTDGGIEMISLNNDWILTFNSIDDKSCMVDSLVDWSKMPRDDMKYYSGTATYSNKFNLMDLHDGGGKIVLDLGDVRNMASVRLNGHSFPVMWKSPFMLDITSELMLGENEIEIDVTNLWVNRMIGDEHEPDDVQWSEPLQYIYAPGKPVAGRFMTEIPEWLEAGSQRPSNGRRTVVGFKFFNADSPLLPSGLLGPVRLYRLE